SVIPISMIIRAFILLLLFISSFTMAVEKPNVILILCDDVGYECFSTYGSKEYSTPRLDALARGGMRFDHCHSTPLCTPSRVNLLSGKSNVFNYYDFGIYPKDEPTFAQHFKSHGYATAVAGKWQLLTSQKGISPAEAGFDTHCLWNIPGTSRERYWNPSLMQDGELLDLPEDTYGPDVTTDFLVDFIKKNSDQPFLAYFPMILPHNPFPVTPDSADPDSKNEKQNFIDMVQYIDKNVGRLEDTLTELGLRDNTLIIFTSDNGTNASLPATEINGQTIKGAKGMTRDHGTHVPLIVNWPGKIAPDSVNDDLICFSDFFATMVEATGIPAKEITDGDGWSFWPQCQGQAGTKRDWIYCYYFPRPSSKKFDLKYSHHEISFARNKRFKLYSDGRLFDTQADILEKSPLPEDSADTSAINARKALQKVLDSYPKAGQSANRREQ
ncbi:MAG: sulfatase-like hydrolase/transferase, partial [Verrucomicrobiota bacterium]